MDNHLHPCAICRKAVRNWQPNLVYLLALLATAIYYILFD